MKKYREYSNELADKICFQIADGKSVRSICKQEGMPNKWSILRWLQNNSEFRDLYIAATELRADKIFEECLEIADDTSRDHITRTAADGSTFQEPNPTAIFRARVRIDTRKWMLGRMFPKKYGDRVAHDVGGDGSGPVVIVTGVPRAPVIEAQKTIEHEGNVEIR